jgi:hypothetical protein
MAAIFYSPSTRGFHFQELFGQKPPADAVRINRRRHAQLLALQAAGAEIMPGPDGRPIAQKPVRTVDQQRAGAVLAVKAEAQRRILAIAPAYVQANDTAAIAMAALQEGLLGDITIDFLPAVERRERIDAVRAASNRIEAELAGFTAAQLAAFFPSDDSHWN